MKTRINLLTNVKNDGQATVNRQSTDGQSQRHYTLGLMKYAAIITLLLTLACGNVWGQTTIYNTGWESGIGTWDKSSSLTITEETTNVRTGSKAIKGSYTGSNSAKNAIQATGTTTTSEKATYCHIIGWAKSANGTMKAQIGFNSSKKCAAVTLSTSNWTQLSYVGNEINATTIILYKQGNASADKYDVYFDDVVSYYSSSNTTDVTAPSAATSASATTSSISWTNGSDSGTGATGIQNTMIWRRTDGSSDDLTLNAQGIYAASASDQSGHWTCVSATVSSAATSYDGTFSAGDRYAIVHRDLAYNYSSPTYVTITSAGTTWYVKGSFDSWGDGFNFTGAGTELTATVNITTAGLYEFKINNSDGDAWYGNTGNIGCNVSGWTFSTGESANCKFFASETGNYTFTFNTSTKALSVTYPTAQGKYYYKNTGSWGTVAVYRYVGGINNGWPGTIVAETETICGDTYYVTYADPGTTLIFNNNDNGSQTGNETASGNAGKYVQGTDGNDGWRTFPTYTISYDAGSGSGTMSSQSSIACGTDKATSSNTFTAPSGYQFAGWVANVDVTVGGSTKTAGTVLDNGVTIQNISSNITLTAQWELIPTYDVIYNTNGGTGGSTASQTGNLSGAQVTTSANGFTKTGYKFKWWNTAANGSGEDFYPGEKVTIASANVNLYAQWEQVSDGWEFWCGSPNAFTTSQAVVGDMVLTAGGANVAINTDLTADPTIVSKYNSSVDKHAICIAVPNNDQYIQVSFSDGSPINTLKVWATNNQTSSKKLAVIYSTTADFSSGEYEAKEVSVPANNAASKALTDFSPATADKYFYARIYRKVATAVYEFTGGSGNTARIYGVKAQKGANCTAPSALAAATPTAKGITLSVTDANNVNNYEFYVSTSSTAPEAGATATHSVSSAKSLTITNLVAGTTYYAWARSVCGVSNKSGWTALGGGGTFTTSTVTMTPTLTNVTKNSGAESGIGGSDYTAEFEADDEYSMPDPTVTIGGNAATSGTDYTWSVVGSVGTITIPANKINGNIAITLNSADAAPSSAVISGTYHYFPGENISLTCTPSGNNGPTTYQWYKGGKADGNAIDGATSATYTKNSCAFADAGKYYCKVTCNETSIWAETNDVEDYDVKILHLYVNTGRNGTPYDDVDFVKVDGSTATASISLGANWDYGFNIADGCGHYYGNSGKMTEDNCTDWSMDADGTDCLMRTTNGATYTFTVDYSNLEEPVVSISYPSANQAADKVIYFDNQAVQWSTLHYRIGRSDHTQATAMTKVSGTNNLYSVTTAAYNNFSGWHIANNAGWTGSNSIYRTDTDGDEYEITYATAHEGGAVTESAVTVTPTTSRGNGSDVGINDNCEFYNYSLTTGMKTQNVAISPYSNGTITVNYTNTSNVASTLTSGNADLAHSVILTSITAVANTGYDASAITINGGAYSANYVVTGATVVAATFTPHVYTITLNKGDHGASNQSAYVAYLDDELTSITHVTSTGYTLTGYYDGSTKVLNANGSFAASTVSGYIEDGVWTKTANATLTAKWEAMTTTLTFDANTTYHGTTGDGGATATYDATELSSVTHTTPAAGYQLDGYYTTATGEGTKIVTASGSLVASTSYTTAGGAWQSALANLTLYARYTDKSYSVTHTFTDASRTSGGSAGASAATHGTDYSVIVAATSGYALPSTITVTIGGETATSGTEYTWNQASGTVTIGGSYITGDIVITITSNVDCPSANSGAVVYKWEVKSNVTDGNICSTQNVAVSLNTTTHLTTLTGGTLQGLVTSSSMNNLAFSSGRIQYANGGAGVLILTLDCAVKTGDIIRFVNYSSSNSKYNYLRHTSNSTTTNQITLNANNGAIQEIVVPSAFNDKDVLYIVSGSNTTAISYFEIIRPYVVTLDANTNGGNVGGENTVTYYAASGEEIALPHAFKSGNYFNGWFPNASTGDAVSNPYTPTGSTTLYAQFGDCPSSGTVYKFQVATGLTNGNVTEGEVNLGNYVSALEGGSLTAHQNSSKLTIVSNSKIQFADNNVYLKIDLDCALQTGDKFITSIETDKLCITNTGSRSTTNELVVGTKTETNVPAAFVGSKTLWIWRNGTNSKITYFEIVRTDGVTITGAVSPDGYGTVSPASIFVASGSTVSLASNVLTCDGKTLTATPTAATAEYTYAFSSWSGVTNGGTVSVATTATANFTRTANNYTLTWNTNGGSDLDCDGCTSGSTAYNTTLVAPSDPTLSNYTFDGWKTNNDGTGTTAGATMPASDVTYYAAWKQTVTLTTGAQGSGDNQTPYVYLNGTGVSSITPHTADGYTLQGYYTAGSGGTKVLNADGTFAAANVTDYITSSKWSRNGAAPTLYAQWVASEDCSTSDFVIKKGSDTQYQGCMESTSYDGTATSFTAGSATTVGNAKMTISSYSKGAITRPGSGNTFSIVIEPVSGYYLKSICWAGKVESGETVSYYWDDDSGSATTISAQTTSGTGVTYNAPSSTTKFTASYVDDGVDGGGIWWRNVQVEVCAAGGTTYKVTYDDNGKTGGSVPTDATNYSYGGTVTVIGNTGSLEKTNYTFAGWTTNDDGTGSNYVADNTFSITGNTTLYAKWTQAVTFDANTANHGSTGGSATAVWNATGLTGITHATPASGYKLTGYYTAATSGTKVLNSDGSFAATAVDGYVTDGKWSRTGTASTLYAQYESAGALTWNLVVKSDTSALSTSTKTSAFTEIAVANMTNAALTGLTYTKSSKSSLTGKISTPASYDADKYVYVTFQVASGYKFTPSSIKVIAQPVTTGKDVKLSLTDGAFHSLVSSSATSISDGSTQTVTLAGDGTYFTGTVTLKIYCYGATDAYRLGTPITIEGEIEEACATMPSYTSMSYTTTTFAPNADASGSPITIVGGDNINTYQWKYNTVNDRTSGTNCGTGTSLTPLTDEGAATDGTRYYWCEMTNTSCGITIKSPAVAITVAAAKSDATVTWTDPASTPNYGGGGYTIKATVYQTGWDGNAADLVITAPAGINIYNVTSGTTSSQKWVQVNFDVQTSFDRSTYASNIPFTVSTAATATYNAISDDYNVSYSACAGAGEGSSYNIRMRKTVTKDGNYYHSANTDGWISPNISSSHSTAKAGTTMATVFDTVASSNTQYVWVRTYHANVNKVRIYADFRANDMTVSNVYKHTDYFSADSKYAVDYTAVYNGDEENENTGTAAQGYVDITLDEVMAANDILLVKFNDNKVRPLGAVITEGSAGSLNTYLQWSGDLEDDATVDKYTTDAYFTYSASKITENTNTLGAITYSSSDPSVATVDATGKVALVAAGSTTIKATLAASGCYKKAEISYTLNVAEVPCEIAAGTLTLTSGTESKCSSDNVTLTLTGFESGASIQWKDGDTDINNGGNYTIATDGTTSTLTTNQEGTYSVIVTTDCSVRSNRITISNISTEVGAKRIVKNWYIKNGRLTPDIELWTLQNGAHLSSVAWSPANATGLTASDFYESDGKVYLKGKEPSSNTSGADIDYTLTLTVEDDCGSTTAMSAAGQLIYLHHQKNTDKHVLAFVVNGTDKGGFTEGITAAQTTSVPLYNEIAANFDVLATNIRSTDDEQALKEYYSQFDILCVTDYPNTGDKGVNKKSYVDALGALVDIRPILTMEAWVSKLANWKAKGISGTPKSPTTRQYTMLLQCKDHEIFSGTELTKVGEGDETMYRVSMVDNTQEEYVSLDATYGDGAHADKSGYEYASKPALQGFTFTKEMLDNDLLPLGLIDDGSGNDLQVGIERQAEMEARLMVLGINSYAMERLTDDGQTVVVNALKYLMKKNSEDIADCSNTFVGGDDEEDESTRYDWNVDSHWSGNAIPDRTQKVRIVAPCVIKADEKFHVTGVVIAPSGEYNHGANTANGSLTIAAGGALIVDGKVEAATAPYFSKTRATSAGDLTIEANSTAQGALILDNEDGETNATVAMYSASHWETVAGKKKKYWSYVALPIQSGTVGEYFYNGFSYLYDETEGWIKKGMYTELHAFEGLGISMQAGNMEYFHGALAPTTTQEFTLTYTAGKGEGENLIGNSWTAPIQIANFDASDFGDATATVYVYNTGRDDENEEDPYGGSGSTTAGQWISVPISSAKEGGYTGLKVIPAMNAFQVNTSSETTLTLDYDKLVRGGGTSAAVGDLTVPLRAPKRSPAKAQNAIEAMMCVRMSGEKTHADVWLQQDERFSNSFDNGWEATYVECDNRSPQFYAQSEIGKMAFLALPDLEGTVLGLAPSRDGNECSFTFHYLGEEEFYLNDLKLHDAVLINEENSYEFTYSEGDTNRFYISRTAINAPTVTTGVGNTRDGVNAQKILYNNKLYIIINGRVYSAEGALVK